MIIYQNLDTCPDERVCMSLVMMRRSYWRYLSLALTVWSWIVRTVSPSTERWDPLSMGASRILKRKDPGFCKGRIQDFEKGGSRIMKRQGSRIREESWIMIREESWTMIREESWIMIREESWIMKGWGPGFWISSPTWEYLLNPLDTKNI